MTYKNTLLAAVGFFSSMVEIENNSATLGGTEHIPTKKIEGLEFKVL
jgi:hypothetical protein